MIITIFDLETTGLDRDKDSIIWFAGMKIDSNNWKILETISQLIQPEGNYTISLGAYYKHHITTDMLKDKPTLKEFAPTIIKFFEDSENILTYNGNSFDIPFLKNELNKIGLDIDFMSKKCYDAFLEEKRRNGNKLSETYKRYKGKSMEEAGLTAHDALSDIKATLSIFIAQRKHQVYQPEKMYGEDNVIVDMMFNNEIKPCFNIGKYKGISIEVVSIIDQKYIQWCVSDTCNFMKSTKEFIKNYLK